MKTVLRLLSIAVLMALASCTSSRLESEADVTAQALQDIPGLQVSGARTRANVIQNITPLMEQMQQIYTSHQAAKPGLKGAVAIRLTVANTGEVKVMEILENTIIDQEFNTVVLRPLDFMKFDDWSGPDKNTEIIFPVEFEK